MLRADFETTSRDEALELARRVYDNNFSVAGGGSFYLSLRRDDFQHWTSDRIRIRSGAFRAEPYGFVSVGRLTSGSMRLTAGRTSTTFRRGDVFLMADATQAFTSEWAEADCSMLRLPIHALERALHEAQVHPQSPRLSFLSRAPVTSGAGRRFARIATMAERSLADDGGASDELMQGAIAQLLAAAVLTTFPNTLVPESATLSSRTDVPGVVAMATDFIARNADLPLRITDIAAHVSLSPRGLQLAFRRHLNTSPTEYLRRYRLARIHEELATAGPEDDISVTRVAARWTFTDSSRFAAHYRRVYGELPSQTRRRDH